MWAFVLIPGTQHCFSVKYFFPQQESQNLKYINANHLWGTTKVQQTVVSEMLSCQMLSSGRENDMLAFALMLGTACPCTIHGFPPERLIKLQLDFYLNDLRLNLTPWEGILGRRKDSLLIPYLTTTNTEHCPQERVLDKQLLGSHMLCPFWDNLGYNYKFLVIMTGKIFKNSTVFQGREPLPDQHTNHSPSLSVCVSI